MAESPRTGTMALGTQDRALEGGDVPRKVAPSPERWKCPLEGKTVPRKVAVCPQEGDNVLGKAELSLGSW